MNLSELGEIGYVVNEDYSGLVDISIWPSINLFKDLIWRGWAVFEVMEARENVVFHMDDHLDRLTDSMNNLCLPFPREPERLSFEFKTFLKDKISSVLRENKLSDSLVRVYVTGGHTEDGLNPVGSSSLYIMASPFTLPRFGRSKGLKLKKVLYQRDFPYSKHINYSVARVVTSRWGGRIFGDILYVNKKQVLETSTGNFFIVQKIGDGVMIKTALNDILHGVTRGVVIDLAKKRGHKVEEGVIWESDLLDSDEVFVASTTKLVWPVTDINDQKFPIGDIALGLRKDFLKYRRNYFKKNT
ncbi:aminotransferase class IV [Patescibacteria group bacterium]